ncbi:hypothetical protein MKW94_018452 [Papaver nudicaule]|uniref:Myb/SANT-like domain-containing protein n=1 Tax=Papaver nudicaule TaxID=74823 RepID=A0AA42B0U9_PAPNU|nr:hypothetical protein [Papaver nudicaule]MCL7047337.1 hypothetical protein [Papaver nudicaule]
MVVADDNMWDTYIKAHPDARSYRTKITPFYDELCKIYGGSAIDEKVTDMSHNEDMEDDSSSGKSSEMSGETPAIEGPAIEGDSAYDIENSSHPDEEGVSQRSTEEGTEFTVYDVENPDHSSETPNKQSDKVLSVQGALATVGSSSIVPTGDAYRSRVSWTPPMDRYFIDLMMDHVRQGNKIGRTFSKEAWMNMIALFSDKFGAQYDKDVLYNRFKTLRKQYVCIRSLLAHGGFEWDETLHMVKADVHVWDDYIKAHPEVRQYRVRPVPYYKELSTIYGDTSGRNGNLGGDPADNVLEDSSYLNGDILNQHNKRLPKMPMSSGYSKKLKNTEQSMIDAILEMASAVTSLAEKTKETSDTVSIDTWMAALRALPDIDEELFLDACDFLEVDEKRAKTFVVLDAGLRKKWLIRKLRPS